MAPKICSDEDGDIPPCSVTSDLRTLEEWEKRKIHEQRLTPWKERKAPCSCRYFEGYIGENHKCFIPIKQSKLNMFRRFIMYKLTRLLKSISCTNGELKGVISAFIT
jgi:hypothetical protein